MRIAGIQADLAWEDPATNFERLGHWIRAAAHAGARLVVLPEMFAYGFSMNTEAIAEAPTGPSTTFLRDTAAETGVWLTGSLPMRHGAKTQNVCVLAGPNGALHRYAKIHPFTFAHEDRSYEAGTEHVTVPLEGLRCTLFVCYDLRFADEFWATAERTDCYIVVANWPRRRREHWTTLLRARAIENQAYVVGVNRVGRGGGAEYSGDSQIYDPWGDALAAASMTETMVLADVDPAVVAEARTKFPVLVDRRRP